MRTAGIIGGIAPESTIQYYRQIVDLYLARTADGSYPPVFINSIDMTHMLDLIGAGRLEDLTAYLLAEIDKLNRAGAAFAVPASNTPHVVFGALCARSAMPLILTEPAYDGIPFLDTTKIHVARIVDAMLAG